MSHFTTVKTQLRKREPLLQALHDLGYAIQDKKRLVRGYKGQTVQAELTVTKPKGGDFGFRWNPQTEAYELVADLELWRDQIPVERFLEKLTQRYALNTVLAATSEEGFEIAQQNSNVDGSIELVVTRWDP